MSNIHIINGIEVPAPEIEPLEIGTYYYVPCLTALGYYREEIWTDSIMCNIYLKERGLVFLDSVAAAKNAKVMMGLI